MQVPMYSASGLRVQYLKVWEKSNQKVRLLLMLGDGGGGECAHVTCNALRIRRCIWAMTGFHLSSCRLTSGFGSCARPVISLCEYRSDQGSDIASCKI